MRQAAGFVEDTAVDREEPTLEGSGKAVLGSPPPNAGGRGGLDGRELANQISLGDAKHSLGDRVAFPTVGTVGRQCHEESGRVLPSSQE